MMEDSMRQGHARSDEIRDNLTGEHKAGDAGQIVLALLFIIVWTADSFIFKYTTFLNQVLPLTLRMISGAALIVLSGYLARTGLSIVFDEVREKPEVIRKGVFNVVRHPIYLSELGLYLGLLILSISLAAATVWIIAISFLHYIARHEERLLLARFGGEYKQYMRQVPMWIPWPWRKVKG